ncbi:MAG: hypothetical protein A3G18_03640 [Rhodospirillales bacterium RIFCSPLOWO2_12_FULL_58_28]|nr:MAG: hypothetical protein A3H92_00980 [Rhodospirillales bacterium RIFCSPLOWO2_02_FULL_58_16]OHC76855.1 MAG: hypothetical protein A3G18_03640 [Rhodospirillales bacterium RIFCSPLOWO2_12_FULL_58_28]
MTEKPSLPSRLLTLAAAIVLAALALEGICRVFMPHWQDYDSGRFMRSVIVPNFGEVSTGMPEFDDYFAQKDGDFRVRVSINGFGLRNLQAVEFADERIWAVGDSVTFGWGVEADEMYSSIIARLAAKPTYNIASPGTDVCGYQALIARMPETFRPKAVIIGLVLENDVGHYEGCQKRAELTAAAKTTPEAGKAGLLGAKKWLTRYSALYNVLAVSIKRLDAIRDFMTKIGIISKSHDSKRSFDEGEIEIMTDKTAAEFVRLRSILPEATPLAVLIVPGRLEIRDDHPSFRKMRLMISAKLDAVGIKVIDPFEEFKKAGLAATHFAHDGHWNAPGHEIAGRAAADWIKSINID